MNLSGAQRGRIGGNAAAAGRRAAAGGSGAGQQQWLGSGAAGQRGSRAKAKRQGEAKQPHLTLVIVGKVG